jgi:hypothetical protein
MDPSCPALVATVSYPFFHQDTARLSLTSLLTSTFLPPLPPPPPVCPGFYYVKKTACAPGTYSLAGSIKCLPCKAGAGNYCPLATDREDGYACPGGYTCAGGAEQPVACAAGYFSASGATACSNCTAGTFSTAASSSCTTCGGTTPIGAYCPDFATSASGAPCPDSYVCKGGTSAPVFCDSTGASPLFPNKVYSLGYSPAPIGTEPNCVACPAVAGEYCKGNGLVFPCPEGYVCAGVAAAPLATAATPGRYIPLGSITATNPGPRDCEGGYACLGTAPAARSPCREGQNSAPLSTLCSNCTVVPGRYCPAISTAADNTAGGSPCSPGSFCPGAGSPRLPCPAGYFSRDVGSTVCTMCTNLTYSYANATSCSPCSASYGNYCGDGSPSPLGMPCPPGNSCDGGVNLPNLCMAGSYATGGNYQCDLCPIGTYGATRGLTTAACTAPCTPMGPGRYCPANSTANTPFDCPAGSRCPGDGSSTVCGLGFWSGNKSTTCSPCPPGRWGGAPGLTSSKCSGNCTLPEGSYCDFASAGPLDGTPCPRGFSCAGGATLPTCCTGGTYFTYAGCQTCAPGYYGFSPRASSFVGQRCQVSSTCAGPCTAAPGFYCPAGSTRASGYLCPFGRFCAGGTAQPM